MASNTGDKDFGEGEFWGDCEDEQLLKAAECVDGEDADHDDVINDDRPPLRRFRPGYLWVSDFSSQMWCEQQFEYSFTMPTILVEDRVMTKGSEMHLERELEVQDTVSVNVTTREDSFAVKVMNLVGAVNDLLTGTRIRREIPIFGAPFGEDVFLMGIIDQIECDLDTFTFDIWEYKTRAHSKSVPSRAQQKTHKMQLMIYKKLFDDLIKGKINKELLARHRRLDLSAEFGDDVKNHLFQHGIESPNLNALLDFTFERMQCLSCINQLLVEYCYQGDKSTIAVQTVDYDEDWLESEFKHHISYWKGERKCHGVDIEEAWKCQSCDFADVCSWRQEKAQEYAARNSARLKNMRHKNIQDVR